MSQILSRQFTKEETEMAYKLVRKDSFLAKSLYDRINMYQSIIFPIELKIGCAFMAKQCSHPFIVEIETDATFFGRRLSNTY